MTGIPIADFLEGLGEQDIRVWVEDGRVRCNAPKGALTEDLKRQLRDRKQEILDHFAEQSEREQLRPAKEEERRVLSFGQERLWFQGQMDPDSAVLNIAAAQHLPGEIHQQALEQAVREILRRHEVLRSTFPLQAGVPTLMIPPIDFELALTDVSEKGASAEEVRQRAHEACMDLASEPYDLENGPLFRVHLVRAAEHDHVLVIGFHHIVSDGWSMLLFQRELRVLYESYAKGEASPLPEPALQFPDYAAWQRRFLSGARAKDSLSYWKKQLASLGFGTELPPDRPRPRVQTFVGDRMPVEFTPELTEALRQWGVRSGATMSMMLLSAFQVVLHRFVDQDDVVVGTPMAERPDPRLEGLIGFFLNTLVLRTDLSGDPTGDEVLKRVREVCLNAFAHQEVPFERVVDELQPRRDLSRSPLFQIMYTLHNAPTNTVQGPEVKAAFRSLENRSSMFDLSLMLFESDRITGFLEYNTDLYDADTMERLSQQIALAAEHLATHPDQPISTLSLLRPEDRCRLLEDWNQTEREFPVLASFADCFEAQVTRAPERVAVEFGTQSLTYEALNRRANQLARFLQGRGVKSGDFVGLKMERGAAMVVGLLAIQKAGAVYIPLDPAYPEDRVEFMLNDSGAAYLLTDSEQGVGDSPSREVIAWNRDGDEIAKQSEDNLSRHGTPKDLAYVIYTSGSTGKPKGVQISHGALLNFLYSMAAEPGLHPDDTLLSVTTLSFDISGLEMYLPLMVGAKVVVASREVTADGNALATLIDQCQATVMQATPATWHLLIASGWKGKSDLKVLCGGEALTRSLASDLAPRCRELWNMFGPTETTIWSTVARISRDDSVITVGRPIANTQCYILDAHGNPAPVGLLGELHLGGAGLAEGYLGRPELTAERFVAHPYSEDPEARLYRTGDLARYLPDGRIVISGRMDHQVKLRGFRIELGEIESRLASLAAVEQALVLLREDAPGDERLCAYLVSSNGLEIPVSELRERLRQFLPEFMVPANYVFLGEFPTTPNGKVDRQALPAPAGVSRSAPFEAPATDSEKHIAEVWKAVLQIEQVSVQDNFFDLGGHSLLSVRVIAQLESKTGVRLNPREFVFQTLRQVAAVHDQQAKKGAASSSPKKGLRRFLSKRSSKKES